MERTTLLAVVLALATFFVWDAWMDFRYPDRGEVPEVAAVEEPGDGVVDAEVEAPPGPGAVLPAPAMPEVAVPPAEIPTRRVPFEACGVQASWSTRGGYLQGVVLEEYRAAYDIQAVWSWLIGQVTGEGGAWKPYGEPPGQEELITPRGHVLGMGTGELTSPSAPVEVVEEGEGHIVLRGVTADGIEVVRTVTAEPGDGGEDEACTFAVETSWRNVGTAPYQGTLWLGLHDVVPESAGRYGNVVQPYAYADGDYEWMNLKKLEGVEAFPGPVRWLSLADRYFTLALMPAEATPGAGVSFSELPDSAFVGEIPPEFGAYGLHYTVPGDLAPGAAHTEAFTLYIGPKELSVLRGLDDTLPKLVNLGIFAFFGKILLWLLRMFHGLVGHWGISIILLTLLVKGLFFPLTQTAFKSSQAMQALQPDLQAIREEYKDKPEEMNRRTMALFKERGVNPLGGCLPMLVQFPVWIALYQVLLNSVELYHTEFLYLRDLSSIDPYGALPAVVVVLMVVQQQFMPTGNMDPTQARMMKLMPLIFGFFFFAFPSGLVVYIFVNMVLTIIQQWLIKRTYKAPAAATSG